MQDSDVFQINVYLQLNKHCGKFTYVRVSLLQLIPSVDDLTKGQLTVYV